MLPILVLVLFMLKDDILVSFKLIWSMILNLFHHLVEKDLDFYFREIGVGYNIELFQLIRLLSSILVSMIIFIIYKKMSFVAVLSGIMMYKLLYLYLYLKFRSKKLLIKQQLPYLLKTIIYFCYIYPVSNALQHAIDLVPNIYRDALSDLVKQIDEDPISFEPYYIFYERLYEPGDNFLMYMRVINRIALSGGGHHHELLSSIDNNVSSELNVLRRNRNMTINGTVQYLGLLPVLMVTMMLGYLLILVSQTI